MADKEYIEREKALAFQNELEPLLCRNVVTHDVMSATKDVDLVKYLRSIPAADVRPVVRCRDCKHGQGTKMDFWNEYEGIECVGGVVHRKDWFCADGEKKVES